VSAFDPSQIEPAAFARSLRDTPDEQLREGLRSEYREMVLDGVFDVIARQIDQQKAGDTDAVIHWKVGGRADGGHDLYELKVRGGRGEVSKEATEPARLTLSLDALDFLKLVTGNESGPKLFMVGRLRLEGDLLFAARLQSLFRMPEGLGGG
jgi:putative sterol carrier protein